MKRFIIIFLVVIIIGIGFYFITKKPSPSEDAAVNTATDTAKDAAQLQYNNKSGEAQKAEQADKSKTVIGKSVEEREIIAYHYGQGGESILFVGGIHGGYSWNTTLVAYEMMDYLKANPSIIPANVKATIIPVLNPDGLYKVVGTSTAAFTQADVSTSQEKQVSGRFNANDVDLNRNFDCDWQTNAKWQSKAVSGGSEAFSEPESLAIKNYIETQKPKAVVVWYSAASGVFASSCHNGVLPETLALTNVYAKASGYPAYESFNFYEITGDMVNWLAKKEIPAISVLLTNHTDTERTKNQAGIKAILGHYAQ